LGTPIQISTYDDKLMLWNPGELPQNWTVDRLLRKHASKPFNPDVANAFFRTGKIETWGRGIERILEACKTARTPKPQFRQEHSGIWVEFPFPKLPAKPKDGTRLDEKLGKNRATILRLMRANSTVTVSELAAALKISRTATDKNIQVLKSQGYLKRVGPAKGGRWEVLK
jgi:ATP-dependent DNA helicase RecG